MPRLVSWTVIAALVLGGLSTASGCSGKGAPESPSGRSKVSTAPVNSTTDVGAIRGKTNRAAVAADLRTAIASGETAATIEGTQPDPDSLYRQAVQQVAAKYGITAADVEDVARQYGIAP